MDNLETAEDAVRRARASLAETTAASGAPAAWIEPLRLALDAIESAVAELSELRDAQLGNTEETGADSSYIR
jgi:3-hydroxy-3-methylglutaryl CoA synthase